MIEVDPPFTKAERRRALLWVAVAAALITAAAAWANAEQARAEARWQRIGGGLR